MIIDCHAHIGKNEHINFSVHQLLKSMDKAKIDKTLVFAGKINDCSNEWMLEQIAPYKDRLYGVAAADMAGGPITWRQGVPSMTELQDEASKITDWYAEGKIIACKFYTGYHHYYPFDRLIEDYLSSLEEVGCPAIFHCGDCLCSIKNAKLKYAHPLHIDDIAVDYPNMNFVIAHVGFPWVDDTAEVCYKNKNVYTDISGFVYNEFDVESKVKFSNMISKFLDIASNNKLLFGTDCPISNQQSYRETVEDLLGSIIFENMQKNIRTVFNLK